MKKPPMSGPATDETPNTRAEEPRVAPALARGDDIADRRLCAHHQPAAAESLDGAERDQLGHPLREPAQHRADQEDHERRLEHELAPVEVAELAVQRRHDRHREQVRGDDPADVVEPAELADDRGQRGRDDRLVERRQQHHEEQGAHDQPHAWLRVPPLLAHHRQRARLRRRAGDLPPAPVRPPRRRDRGDPRAPRRVGAGGARPAVPAARRPRRPAALARGRGAGRSASPSTSRART